MNSLANLFDPYEGRAEILKIVDEYRKNPTEKNRQGIKLANEVAEARKKYFFIL
ncbi:hypothetical protein [Rickettsiella massiliensis]|uniref:hypothetical protein n=1 Tax=Rickettsiella massiliensis TaxID=676517 RepID=UPI000305DFDE|nr:hypothetical protein [Rickettsiella massiliensis]